jgi:hypothetical protein
MPERYVDPEGNFALEAGPRATELWSVLPIRFEQRQRPAWQQRPGGAVARLHQALRAFQPEPRDVLAAIFSDRATARPDVENRLFTNVKERPEGTPKGTANPFASLPRSIVFERRFNTIPPPEPLRAPAVHYRYTLTPDSTWSAWQPSANPLAIWNDVRVSRLGGGAGWPIWLGMATSEGAVRVIHDGPHSRMTSGLS